MGLFTYALILGLVAEAVQSASQGFKKGNGEVVEVGHTVMMHTNSATKKVLRQVCIALRALCVVPEWCDGRDPQNHELLSSLGQFWGIPLFAFLSR